MTFDSLQLLILSLPLGPIEILRSLYNGISLWLASNTLTFLTFFHFVTKFYRALCFSRLTLDWLPMINPYTWPFYLIKVLTEPYFRWWQHRLPNLRLNAVTTEFSALFALEAINTVSYILLRLIIIFFKVPGNW